MSDPLRIGVIGGGAITQVAHLPVLHKMKGVSVRALCDIDAPKARALASRFQVPDTYDDIEELLDHEELDALLVCSPNHLHEAHVVAALTAGLHVFVERPLAMTAATALKVQRAAEKRDRVVFVGMNLRYRADVQAVRGFIAHGELGAVDSIRASWHTFRPARTALGWRQRKDQAGGGAMFDLGLPLLDLAFFLTGGARPQRVSAAFDREVRERAVETSGTAFVVCENGLSIVVDVTRHHIGEAERFGFGIRAEKGSAGVNPLHVYKELNGVATDVSPTGALGRENPFTMSVKAEWAHFVAMVRGDQPRPDLAEHVLLHRVLDAIYKSAAEGRDVEL